MSKERKKKWVESSEEVSNFLKYLIKTVQNLVTITWINWQEEITTKKTNKFNKILHNYKISTDCLLDRIWLSQRVVYSVKIKSKIQQIPRFYFDISETKCKKM